MASTFVLWEIVMCVSHHAHQLTFKDSCGPASLQFRRWHDGPKWLDEANDSQRWLLQLKGEDMFIQRGLVVFNFDDGLLQEGKREAVASGEDDNIHILLHSPIFKDGGGFSELLHDGLHHHAATEDAAWKVVIEHWLFHQDSGRKQDDDGGIHQGWVPRIQCLSWRRVRLKD